MDVWESEGAIGESRFSLEAAVADDAAGLSGEERTIGFAAHEWGEVLIAGLAHQGVALEAVVVAETQATQFAVWETVESNDEDHGSDASVA